MTGEIRVNATGLASDAALRFIAENNADIGIALTAATVERFRADARADFLPRAERAVKRHSVGVETVEIGGVSCLQVTPAEVVAGRTVFYCYGGGYVTGSAREDLIVSAALADLAKTRIIAPCYRLAPENPWPAAVDDGFAVYRALSEQGGEFAVAGESAGGNLALAVLLRAQEATLPMPKAAVLLSPWCDLSNAGDSIAANDGRDPMLNRAYVDGAAELYAGINDRCLPDISPIYGAFDRTFPPMLITTGTRDLLMSQCVRLANVLQAAGVSADLRVWDNLWHVFEFFDEIPEAALSLREAAAFLNRRL